MNMQEVWGNKKKRGWKSSVALTWGKKKKRGWKPSVALTWGKKKKREWKPSVALTWTKKKKRGWKARVALTWAKKKKRGCQSKDQQLSNLLKDIKDCKLSRSQGVPMIRELLRIPDKLRSSYRKFICGELALESFLDEMEDTGILESLSREEAKIHETMMKNIKEMLVSTEDAMEDSFVTLKGIMTCEDSVDTLVKKVARGEATVQEAVRKMRMLRE